MRMEPLKDRLKAIKDLEEFLGNSHQTLGHVYQEFGWKEREFQISRDGDSKCNKNEFSEELLLPDPLPQSLVNSKTRLIIDYDQQEKILQSLNNEKTTGVRQPPKASGELIANFSREERLAIHNHVLATTAVIDPPPEIMIPDEVESSNNQSTTGLSHIELMKLERDMKRRRHAYRTKVSTKNKTQTEVTREIIANMMEFLEPKKEEKHLSYMNDKKERDNNEIRKGRNETRRYDDRKNHKSDKNKEKHESSSHMYRKSNYRRSRSRERETSRDRRYKRERRSHSRDRKKYEQASSNEIYSKEISSMNKEKSKNKKKSEYNSKYELDETYLVNEEIIPGEFQINNPIDSYVKKEKDPEQSTEERLSTDSENEKKKDTGLSKSSDSQNKKVGNDSMKHESRKTERYLSEGEIISSDYDSEPDTRKHSKKKKKKKKHKEHKHRHKKKDN